MKRFHLYLFSPLINLIFETGIVLSHFEFSIVTPVYKDKDPININNYRPISVISNLANLWEMFEK